MKKLLIPLLFLITLPTSAQAGGSYEKVMFKKNIGNYGSTTTVEVKKKYKLYYHHYFFVNLPGQEQSKREVGSYQVGILFERHHPQLPADCEKNQILHHSRLLNRH